MAKKDSNGNIITSTSQLKDLYLQTYKHRLRHRPIENGYINIMLLKEELWERRLKSLRKNISPPWTMKNLEDVLRSLKNNQARDPVGMVNELFKLENIGSKLKWAILDLMNCLKSNLFIPEKFQLSNITSIFKNKGSRLDLKNDRGIFILTTLRKILDKLTYNDKYLGIESNMSDSNIGARKDKNIRNHLFVIHGVINSVLNEEKNPIDIQIYDLEQAFDALWLEDCLNDVFDNLPDEERDDKIVLVYESNVSNLVAVNTAVGQTDRIQIPRIVQQGGGWGPMECSNSVDTIGKKCYERGIHSYLYKESVKILPLAMVDDLLGISECGNKSLQQNVLLIPILI